MKVKLNKDLCYARNGYEVITVLSGKIVTGRAAQLAIELGCGTPMREKKVIKPAEKKVIKPAEKKVIKPVTQVLSSLKDMFISYEKK